MKKSYKKCPFCKSENIEHEGQVVVCKSCGFYTMEPFTTDNPEFDNYMKNQPMIIQQLARNDKKQYWLPFILNVYPVGVVYPVGNLEDWHWAFSPYKVIPINERINYPKHDKTGEYFEYLLDTDNEVGFELFSDAIAKLK